MTISVVIPVFGREAVFATVALLRSTEYAVSLHFVVIDNGNAPELSSRLATLAGADCEVIRFDRNRGGSAAYIAGMERSLEIEGDYVWLLDDDAHPNVSTLPELVKAMDALVANGVKVASVGSGVECDGRLIECGTKFSVLFGHATPYIREGLNEVDCSAACSLLINKKAVRECGFWEDVFIHFDDIEWGIRVKRTGWRNFATSASRVIHPKFTQKKAGFWIAYFDARNQYWFAAKFGPVHVALAWLKNRVKDFRAVIAGETREANRYRALAWRDYCEGIRRTYDELVSPINATMTEGGMPKTRIIVATHKPYWMPDDPAYLPVQVGAAGKPAIGIQRDDEGDNISVRNPNWCELTGLYWAWKHLSSEVLGLVHYRRHFKGKNGVLSGAEIESLLKDADVILPRQRNYFIETNYSQYAHAHHAIDLDTTREILVERCPEYVPFWDASMKSTKGHRFNMFIMKRELVDRYCAWLFDILFELERRLDISDYSMYDIRVFGFVSERLMDPWLAKNCINYVEVPVWNLESQCWGRKIVDFVLRKARLGGKRG